MDLFKYVYLLLASLILLHSVSSAEDVEDDEVTEEEEELTPEQGQEIERLSKMEGHLKPLGSVGPYFDLYIVEGFPSPRDFFNKYVIPSTPLLMKNAAKISEGFTKWTDEYFINHPASKKEQIYAEGRKKEIRTEPGSTMSFKQFVEHYNTTDMYMVHGLPYYLKPDLLIPPPLQCDPVIENIADVVTWFSSGGTKSVLHNDDVDNINCLYRGDKTLVFLNPHDKEEIWSRIIDKVEGSYSSLDVDAVDFTKFPDLANVRYSKVDMQAGDCLYIPYRWYHQVNSFGSNLAVNLWWKHETERFLDLNDEICGDFTGRNTIANISYPGMDGDSGAYGEEQPEANEASTEKFFKTYGEKQPSDQGSEEAPSEASQQEGGQSYSEDYDADELHKDGGDEKVPTVDETDPEEDPYIEPEEDSITDKIYQAILRIRRPVQMSGVKKYVLKKMGTDGKVWDDRCQDILINYFGMLDQNKDTVITVEDIDLYYAQDENALSQSGDVTAFFQEDLSSALNHAASKKERELVQKLLDRGELDKEQIAKIFGDKLIMPGVREHTKDEL